MKDIKRVKEQVEAAVKQMDMMYEQGAMGAEVYYKCLVSLAYEYVCCDELQMGLIQLARVPASYFQDVQLRQMREDGMYRDLVVLLSYKLIQMGIIEGSEELITPTMPLANA